MPTDRASLFYVVGGWLFMAVVVAVACSIALSFAMNDAADDLRLQVRLATNESLDHPRTGHGAWFAVRTIADLQSDDYSALWARADELDHRADRIRELAGVGSLAGLVLLLVTVGPSKEGSLAREDSTPVASTSSNGMV
jgi:hypothetical protein